MANLILSYIIAAALIGFLALLARRNRSEGWHRPVRPSLQELLGRTAGGDSGADSGAQLLRLSDALERSVPSAPKPVQKLQD